MRYYIGIIKVAALLILLPVVMGKSTFSKTIQLHKDYRHIQSLEEQLGYSASDKSMLTPIPLLHENLISNGRLVELISRICEENSVSVKQYEPALLDMEGDYKLYTASLILSGNYVDLVKTLKYWEDNIPSIKISTLKFEYDEKRIKDRNIGMTLVFKQVEN